MNTPPLPEVVSIPGKNYAVGKFHVTVLQYRAFCTATGREFPEQPGWSSDNHPIVNVNWFDARDYCKWLSEQTGEAYRLPDVEEYEHFCADHAVGTEETAVFERSECPRVGTKKPNQYGLYDVVGLAFQWMFSEEDIEEWETGRKREK